MAVLGISCQGVESHKKWADKLGFKFPVLADPGGEVARAWGVKLRGLNIAGRTTFVLDREGTIAKVYPGVDPKGHANTVLKDLARMGLTVG